MPRKKLSFDTNFSNIDDMTLLQLAEEYLDLQDRLAPLTQRVTDLKKSMKENTPRDTEVQFPNGISVKLSVYTVEHFDVKAFKEEEPDMYNEYMDCRGQTRLTVKRAKSKKM